MQINLNIEKITFTFVQTNFLAMHFTNQKLSFYILTVGNLQNIFLEHERKINNFDPYNVLLAIATNIPHRLEIGFVLQGHILDPDVRF